MNPNQVLQLNEMIKENNSVDNTELIRELKHSQLITRDVNIILNIKKKLNTSDYKILDNECLKNCRFLFDNYTNIYNKLLKGQIDMQIFYKFLHCLKQIEDGKLNQHEAGFEIGTLLKQIYIDPIIEEKMPEKKGLSINWNEYKNMINT
jgi:hypothetical protein